MMEKDGEISRVDEKLTNNQGYSFTQNIIIRLHAVAKINLEKKQCMGQKLRNQIL